MTTVAAPGKNSARKRIEKHTRKVQLLAKHRCHRCHQSPNVAQSLITNSIPHTRHPGVNPEQLIIETTLVTRTCSEFWVKNPHPGRQKKIGSKSSTPSPETCTLNSPFSPLQQRPSPLHPRPRTLDSINPTKEPKAETSTLNCLKEM